MKIVVIDFDGVIADSLTMQIGVVNKYSDTYGYKKIKSEDEFRQHSMQEVISHLKIPKEKIPEVVEAVRKEAGKSYDSVPIFKGIKKSLDILSKDLTLVIVSSNDKKIIKAFLKRNNIDSIFFKEVYTTRGLFDKHRAIQKIMRKFKVSKDETYFISDEQRDIEVGKNLKIITVAVTWGYDNKERLSKEKPDYIFDKVQDLTKIINF